MSRLALWCALLCCGCAAPLRIAAPFCAPPNAEAFRELPAGEALPASSTREAQLAALIGLDSALAERAQGQLSAATRLTVLERLERVRLAIDAVSAELDCEGERTQQAADYLARAQTSQVQAVTVASIITAAAVSVASVLLANSNAQPTVQSVVGIAGAVAAAGLGFGTLYIAPTLHFEHRRNLLRDIWLGPARSQVYPPVVWAYLSRATFSNAQDAPIQRKLVDRFRRLRADTIDARTEQLLFGPGGQFSADLLREQAALLDQVKAEVALQNQDLSALANALLRD